MIPPPSGVSHGVGVKYHEGLGRHHIGIFVAIVGKGVMRPVLLQPNPFGVAQQVGAVAQYVIDPYSWPFPGNGSVIGVVLNVESHQCPGNAVAHGQGHAVSASVVSVSVVVLLLQPTDRQVQVKCHIHYQSPKKTGRGKFVPPRDQFKYFAFEFHGKVAVKLVSDMNMERDVLCVCVCVWAGVEEEEEEEETHAAMLRMSSGKKDESHNNQQ